MSCTESLFKLDIVGTLKPELCDIGSSFGGSESVMLTRQPFTALKRGEVKCGILVTFDAMRRSSLGDRGVAGRLLS